MFTVSAQRTCIAVSDTYDFDISLSCFVDTAIEDELALLRALFARRIMTEKTVELLEL